MANITFYTPVGYGQTTVYSVTGTDAGAAYNKDHLLDGHLTSTWKAADATPDQRIIIQHHGTPPPSWDTVGFWFAEYDEPGVDWDGMTLDIEYASDPGGPWTEYDMTIPMDPQGSPLWYYTTDQIQAAEVYWRFTISMASYPLPSVPEFGQLFLMKKNTTTVTGEYPLSDMPEYMNTQFVSKDGGRHIVSDAGLPIIHYERNVLTTDTANAGVVEDAYNDCKGTLLHFFYDETDTVAGTKVVRWDSDVPRWQDLEFEVRQYQLNFSTLPYIADGATF